MKRILVTVSIVFITNGLIAQNVGINTVTPSAYGHGGNNRLLEIYNSNDFANSQAHLILSDSSVSGAVGSVTWASRAISNSEKRVGIISAQFDATATAGFPKSFLKFYTNNGTSITENLTINPVGNIGIGNTNPSYKLHLGSSNSSLRIEGPSTASTGGAAISVGGFGEIQIDRPGIVGGRLMIKENGNVGINNPNPNVPLSFAPALGKKITLYPGTTGDVGFGVAGNRLQIYSDNPNADVAIGYDAAGTFNEKFAVKPTGALAVSGNVGAPGQVLTSNGAGSAYWSSVGAFNIVYQSTSSVDAVPNQMLDVPGLEANFTLSTNAQVVFNLKIGYNSNYCLACAQNEVVLGLYKNVVGGTEFVQDVSGGGHGYPWTGNTLTSGPIVVNLTPGTYSYKVTFKNWGVMEHEIGYKGSLAWQIFPQ